MPADQKELFVAKTGYAAATVKLSADIQIRLARAGVITGHVLDDIGDPMPFAAVFVERVAPKARDIFFERAALVETNDLGEYRAFGLPVGDFIVSVGGGRVFVNGAIQPMGVATGARPLHNYYPHVEKPEEAQRITIAAGDDKPGIDLTVALPPFGPQLPPGAPPPRLPPAPGGGGSGVIRGRVVRADGLPVRRARVRLSSAEDLFTPVAVPTDDNGRYEFRNLRAGTYLIGTTMLGQDEVAYGQPPNAAGERGQPLRLKSGEVLEHIDVDLPRPAVVSGRILDEYGDPIENAYVRIERIVLSRGRRRLVGVSGAAASQTNDLGRYRIFGLPPGRYLVDAVVGETVAGWKTADWPGYARTYFPGTPAASEAQTVELGAGQQALTVDFALVRGHIARLTGTAVTADGAPLHGMISLVQSSRSGALATPPLSARTAADGTFEFARVAPGEYVLQAATSRPSVSNEGEFAVRFVTVNDVDVTRVALHLSAGSTITGRLSFDGTDPPDDPDFHVSPVPADPDLVSLADPTPARADIHEDLTFEIRGIAGPRRLQLTQAPEGWMLKAVRVNGIDVTDMPLMFGTAEQSLQDVEVLLARQTTSLTIAAIDKAGGAADFRMVAFAVDADRRYPGSRFMAIGVPDRDASARVRSLPAGEYYVAAIDRRVLDDTKALDDGAFLESLVGGATRVTLTDGESRTVSVKVIER